MHIKSVTTEYNSPQIRNHSPPVYQRCRIPKRKGGYRYIYLTHDVAEKTAQRYVKRILEQNYEPRFHDRSYAFRPGRSAHDALRRIRSFMDDGFIYFVNLDVEKCFDNIPHQGLIELISRAHVSDDVKTFCKSALYRKYQLSDGSKARFRMKGFMQGMIIAPIFCNIYLNQMDWWIEKNLPQIRFVRYADDVLILAKSRKVASKARHLVISFVRESLRLKMPSAPVVCPMHLSLVFLGFDLSKRKPLSGSNDVGFEPAPYAIGRVITWLEEITREGGEISYDVKLKALEKLQGWSNYYQLDPIDLIASIPPCLSSVAMEVMEGWSQPGRLPTVDII